MIERFGWGYAACILGAVLGTAVVLYLGFVVGWVPFWLQLAAPLFVLGPGLIGGAVDRRQMRGW